MRNLASIQVIKEINPIAGADFISVATVLGWKVIVKKNEFSVGDKIIYVEIDSVLPEKPEFEFMRERKFRVRTVKMKKQVSQGIVFSLGILPKGSYTEGQDVTEILEITKYETPSERQERTREEVRSSRIKKFFMRYSFIRRLFFSDRMHWPSFISKTDETRIQNIPSILETAKAHKFSVSEKLDGCSATFFVIKNNKKWQFWKPYIFGVCSRNFLKGKKDNSYWWRIAVDQDIENKMVKYIKMLNNLNKIEYLVIQGEIIGEGIQGNKYNLKGLDFFVFNILTSLSSYSCINIPSVCEYIGLKNVPYLDHYFVLKDSVDAMIDYSKGKSTLGNIHREGVVIRSRDNDISFKVINPDFLLKYEE